MRRVTEYRKLKTEESVLVPRTFPKSLKQNCILSIFKSLLAWPIWKLALGKLHQSLLR